MWPFDDIGGALGDQFQSMVASAFEDAMRAIWDAGLTVLRTAFLLADQFSVFTVSTTEGPLGIVWPMMLWISGVLAMGLFSWQLIMTNLRAGRGFIRLVTGPAQYGIALAVTVGLVAAFLAAVDGLTAGILRYGLQSENFTDAMTHTSLGDAAVDGVGAVVLGICAIVGVIPAGIGYVLEMLFRQAAIVVLAGVVPLGAAGLVANVSAPWFWRTARWLLAAIAMKPVLALTLVIGVAIVGGAQDLAGLLAGVGVLVISLFAPFVLFRLFAFVDPNSDAGGAFRDFLAGKGVDSYGPNNPALALAGAAGGSGAMEDAHTDRFDSAAAGYAEDSMDGSGVGAPSVGRYDDQDTQQRQDGRQSGPDDDDDPPSPSSPGGGGSPHPDDDGPRGGGSGGPRPGGGGAAGAVDEAAVIA